MINVLLLSVGSRNKVVQYFKKELKGLGKVTVTDKSSLAPALTEGDASYVVPSIDSPQYLQVLLDICKKEKITGVLSLIDPELSLLAKYRSKFEEIGVTVVGSDYSVCERALDKMQTYEWLVANGYKTAKSYSNKKDFINDLNQGKISFPVFVKPACGSASVAISKVNDIQTLELLLQGNNDLMIQEFLDGQEIGADVYIDMISGQVVSIFTKKKLLMRAGETDKAVSFKDQKLFDLIEKFAIESGYKGQIDIDIFQVDGEYYISEVNPRFGGGYPHAHECGCNHVKLILNNLQGKANDKKIGDYDENVYMMKYNEIKILKG